MARNLIRFRLTMILSSNVRYKNILNSLYDITYTIWSWNFKDIILQWLARWISARKSVELFHQHLAVDISLDAGFNVHVPRFALTGKIEFVYFGPNDEIQTFEQKNNLQSYFAGRMCEPVEKNNPACCPAACPLNCPKETTCSYSGLDKRYKCSCLGVTFVDPTVPDQEKIQIL